MDREAWSASIHGVIKSQTRLSDWTELNWMVTRYILVLVSVCWFWRTLSLSYISVLPNLFGTRDQFYGRQFFYRLGVGMDSGWLKCVIFQFSSVQSLSRVRLCDPMNHSTPGLPVHHQLPEFPQIHLHWVGDAIEPSHPMSTPSRPAPQSFPVSGSFQMSRLFTLCSQSIGVSASTSVLPMNTQDWYPLGWSCFISLQSKGLSKVFSNTTVQKHQFFGTQLSL